MEQVDALHNNLADGDQNKFWRSFKYFNDTKKRTDVYINNLRSNHDIANYFADSFESIYRTRDECQSQKLNDEFRRIYSDYSNLHNSESLIPHLLTWHDMVNLLSNLKTGKATASFLKAEHILLGSPKLAIHLHVLSPCIPLALLWHYRPK